MIAAALLLATQLTPGMVALSLESSPVDRAAVLHAALSDEDARVRGAAARIVAVTDARDLIDDVRTALAKEMNPEAAREEIRALGMSDGVKDLDALLEASKKFGLEQQAWIAVARGAGPAAVDAAIARKEALSSIFIYGLWGHPELAIPLSSRILGQQNAKLWAFWLVYLERSKIALDPKIAAVALEHSDRMIAIETMQRLALQFQSSPSADPKPFLDALDRAAAARPDVAVDESFAREILGRTLGREAKERDEWLDWLKTKTPRVTDAWRVSDQLTPAERKAEDLPERIHVDKPSTPPKPVEPIGNSAFTVMTSLPKGVAGEVLDATHCDANWIGFGFAAIDPAGRVHETDFKDVYTSDACKRALNILFRSSLATDLKTPALPAVHDLLLAHHGNAGNCFDEPDVVPHAASEAVRVTREMVAPKKIRSVEPVYPESARLNRDSGIVILESQINTNGCVTAMRILKPLTPELTSAALISLSQWRFTPALSDGKPVDVIYNLTVNFKLK